MQGRDQSFAELMNSMYKSGNGPNSEYTNIQLNKESIKFNEL